MKKRALLIIALLAILCIAICGAEGVDMDETAVREDGYQLRRDPGAGEWNILSANSSPAIWNCPECGGESDDAFCPWCGAKKPPASVTCTACGAEYARNNGFAFCKQCGAKLESDSPDVKPSDEATKAAEELILKQMMLDQTEHELQMLQVRLEEQQEALNSQAVQITALIGIRKTMILDLSRTLASAGLDANVDNAGNIVLNSSVFFESGKSTIKQEGKELLDRFIPIYLSVLLRDEYKEYLEEIIIEGHTDSTGTYQSNLKLSQDRALQVALHCLNMPSLSRDQKNRLQEILTAKGRSYSDLIRVNGVEDPNASRRVEFKFRLKDSELMEELSRLLADTGR